MQATGSNSPQTTYRLSIHVLVDGFSVSVNDSSGRQLWQAGQPMPGTDSQARAAALRAVLLDGRVAAHPYAQVEVVSYAPSTYVPVELFRRSDVASFYRLTFSSARVSNADIRHRILPGMDVVELFALNQTLVQAVADLYPQAELQGRAGQVVAQAAEADRKQGDTEPRMYVRVEGDTLHVCQLTGGQLRFACTYPASNDADRTYFLMAVWHNLGLDAQRTPCLIAGASEALRQELTNYILNVETCA